MSTININDVRDMETSEMTSAEARLQIDREVGLNRTPYHPFGKSHLNAMYAYFTGKHYFPKRELGTTDSPESGEIRYAIAQECDTEYTEEDRDKNRPFRRKALRDLADEVRNTSDRRMKP